jgi:sugar lactone lactonase YvrE
VSVADHQIPDPRFGRLINPTTSLERLWTGGRWTEGPAYFPAERHLIWSDIATATGHVRFQMHSGYPRSKARAVYRSEAGSDLPSPKPNETPSPRPSGQQCLLDSAGCH